MSVINQMLRDLDARDASEQERTGLPPRLRTLPPAEQARARQWPVLALGVGIGVLVAGGVAAYFMSGATPTPVPVPPPPATTPAVTPAPTLPPPTATLPVPLDAGEMKLSILLASPAAAPQPASPAPAPAPAPVAPPPAPPPPQEAPPQKPAPAAPKPVAAKPAPAAAVAGDSGAASPRPAIVAKPEPGAEAQIDRRIKGGEAHEKAEAEYRKGMQAVKRGDAAAAVPLFRHALELEPGHAKARQALLATLVGGKQWPEARQVAGSGLALDPTQAGWAVILARLQLEQGDAAAAVATLERHAAHATGDADYQGLFAYLLQKQQRPAEAAERFRAGLALRPGEARWWFGLGIALEHSGKAAEAKEAYGKARDIGNLPADMAAVIEQKLK